MPNRFPVRAISRGPKFHFKGFYDQPFWSAGGTRFLCLENTFQDRPPAPGDAVTVGLVDLEDETFHPLASTKAWNFQQGCLAQWLPDAPDDEIVFNDRVEGELRAVVLNVHNGKRRELPRPVQALSPAGRWAAGLNFARWQRMRPGYGYAGVRDPFEDVAQPDDDAVYRMDLRTGGCETLVTLGEVAALSSDRDGRRGSTMWFCHLLYNTDGTRLKGLVRWWCPHLAGQVHKSPVNIDGAVPERRHGMWVMNADGGGLRMVVNDGLVSHDDWRDAEYLLAWAGTRPDEAPAYRLFHMGDGSSRPFGEDTLTVDGHMSYHPRDRRWFVTDTYPDAESMRTLKLYNEEEGREVVVGRFYAPPDLQGELRCDLHPCWSPDGRHLAIDSIHVDGERQIYLVEIGELADL